MKRWVWLLAVPYVVVKSTEYPGYWEMKMGETGDYLVFKDKPFIDDVAEALNEAHFRRIHNPELGCKDGMQTDNGCAQGSDGKWVTPHIPASCADYPGDCLKDKK